ncbi:MAG TPA: hypothetical protein VFH27_10660 [Longimicrobiaceae bacterium]|nr:hypothetical protein [Longimicrobiaceae bacterium]
MPDTLEFRYQPRVRTMLIAIVFFGAAAAVMANAAATNQRELIIEGMIHLSVAGATKFYLGLSVAAALFVVAGALGLTAGRRTPRYVRLTPTEISAPKSFFAKEPTVVPLGQIREVEVQTIQKQRMLNIYHAQGSLTVIQSMLPNPAAFEELHGALIANIERQNAPRRPLVQR